jgi:hypothetical protein
MRSLATFVVIAICLYGCGGSKSLESASTGDIPDWFNSPPQDADHLYAANTATSQDLQLATDKATTGARAEIGRQVEVKMGALQKRFDEEVGIEKDAQLLQQFSSASKSVVSTTLTGSRIKKQTQNKDGNVWRSYVLVEYPIGSANQALVDAIRKNDQLYTRVRASETFKELNEEVQKYEESKAQQTK